MNEKIRVNAKHYKIQTYDGITLISVVITIILLIILSGIVINLSLGDNGIFKAAIRAKEEYKHTEKNDNTTLSEYTNIIEKYTNNTLKKLLAEEFAFTSTDSNWDVENVKEALDYLYNNLR